MRTPPNPLPFGLSLPDYPSEGWLLDEDRALRDLMKGIVVSDGADSERNVEAWFGHPDLELREQKYPYITVDLLEINEGLDRVHRGNLYFDNDPPAWWGKTPLGPGSQFRWVGEMTTPVDLIYQVGTWARNPRHDRQILTQCITGGRTPLRAGMVRTADGFVRRLDFLGHTKRDREEGGKRLFNNIFRMRMSSEVPFSEIERYQRVSAVRINLRTVAEEFRGDNIIETITVTE